MNQLPTLGQIVRKKCKEWELLKVAYYIWRWIDQTLTIEKLHLYRKILHLRSIWYNFLRDMQYSIFLDRQVFIYLFKLKVLQPWQIQKIWIEPQWNMVLHKFEIESLKHFYNMIEDQNLLLKLLYPVMRMPKTLLKTTF